MEDLINRISNHCKLSERELALLTRTSRTLHFPKGSAVVGKGKIDDSIYFITDGVWRGYVERDGEDQTLWFAVPGEYVFSSWGLRGLPSRLTISSSSDSTAIEIKRSTIRELSVTSPGFTCWLQDIYADILVNVDEQFVDLTHSKAGERYLAFIRKMPEIFRCVPLKEIAGYIGVTPQSLSRIRAGLNKGRKG